MKPENWSIRKMREERSLSSLKNTYRESNQSIVEDKTENQFNGNKISLSLILNRVKMMLEEE